MSSAYGLINIDTHPFLDMRFWLKGCVLLTGKTSLSIIIFDTSNALQLNYFDDRHLQQQLDVQLDEACC